MEQVSYYPNNALVLSRRDREDPARRAELGIGGQPLGEDGARLLGEIAADRARRHGPRPPPSEQPGPTSAAWNRRRR